MISGTIRLSIGASNLVMAAIPRDKIANAVLDGGLGPETDVAHEIVNVGKRFGHVPGLHLQHILYGRAAQLLLQKRHHMHEFFRTVVADIIDPRRRATGIVDGDAIDQSQYYTGYVIDMGEVAAHLAMVKELDRRTRDNRPGEQK